jgi:hypothetical protein
VTVPGAAGARGGHAARVRLGHRAWPAVPRSSRWSGSPPVPTAEPTIARRARPQARPPHPPRRRRRAPRRPRRPGAAARPAWASRIAASGAISTTRSPWRLPTGLTPARVRVTRDPTRPLLVLWVDDWPTKPYPLGGPATLTVGDQTLALRPGDRAELAPLLTADRLTVAAATPDRDRDGLPDVLDALIGARKTVQNADAYRGGYESIPFPMGDVPRDHGVCTDVIVRALRNAGIDLQAAVQADMRRAAAVPDGQGPRRPQHRSSPGEDPPALLASAPRDPHRGGRRRGRPDAARRRGAVRHLPVAIGARSHRHRVGAGRRQRPAAHHQQLDRRHGDRPRWTSWPGCR